jgi:hypothetical protein
MSRRFLLAVFAAAALITGGASAKPILSSTAGYAVENGDVNGDWQFDIGDPIYLLAHLFAGGAAPVELAYCGAEAAAVRNGDTNGDRFLDIGDAVLLLDYLYAQGRDPVAACAAVKGGGATPRVAPPNSNAFGLSLAEWSETYWRWNYGGADPAQGMLGRTLLMPMPSGTPMGGNWVWDDPTLVVGSIDVTLKPGTSFVIPQFAWIGERYEGYPTVADDLMFPSDEMLASVSVNLTLDGRPIVTEANEAAFYVPPTPFDPIVAYSTPSSYGSVAAIEFQGCATVFPPLPVGTHVLHLYEPYIHAPNSGLPYNVGTIYDNTWNITVTPK